MEPREAVALAKKHLLEIFSEEKIEIPSLEEIWLDEGSNEWCVTLGLRQADISFRDPLGLRTNIKYKTVRISNRDGKPVSIKNREWLGTAGV